MQNIIKFKYVFFVISLLVILPGIYSMARYGLKLSIDFTGGTIMEVESMALKDSGEREKIKKIVSKDVEVASVSPIGETTVLFRTKAIENAQKEKLLTDLKGAYGPKINISRFETVGPVIWQELTSKAIQAVVVASLAIIIYIAYAFREIPPPYSPWKFGISAVVALVHDVLVVVGVFSILGHLYKVEIDALFVTALLTVIGFSVHDTIVVFDRIRENLRKTAGKMPFAEVVNESILQTLARSLTTSLTVLFTLLALVLFGGESIRWFTVALLVGIFSGTYSSVFNAAPLLLVWEEYKRKKK